MFIIIQSHFRAVALFTNIKTGKCQIAVKLTVGHVNFPDGFARSFSQGDFNKCQIDKVIIFVDNMEVCNVIETSLHSK